MKSTQLKPATATSGHVKVPSLFSSHAAAQLMRSMQDPAAVEKLLVQLLLAVAPAAEAEDAQADTSGEQMGSTGECLKDLLVDSRLLQHASVR